MEAHGQPLRGLRWAGGASLPFLRTEMPLRDIPVFRMAYFPIPHRPTFGAPVFRSAYSASRNARASAAFAASIKPYYGLISKTLMLQVRSAHPPMPHRNVFSKHPGVPLGLFSDSAPTHLRCAGVPLGLFGKPKRSSFSRVRGLHQAILWPLLQNARPPGSLRSPSDAALKCFFKTSRCSARLIRQAETLELQPLRGLRWAGELRSPLHPPLPPPSGYGADSFKGSP